MDNRGLLEKLARLGINMIPQGAAMAGSAIGGPAGEVAGQVLGSGLEQLLSPQQSQFARGMPVGMGAPIDLAQAQPDRLQNVLSSLAGQGAMGLGEAMMPPGSAPNDEWLSIFSKLMQSVPKDELLSWLQSRGKSKVEGAM